MGRYEGQEKKKGRNGKIWRIREGKGTKWEDMKDKRRKRDKMGRYEGQEKEKRQNGKIWRTREGKGAK